CLSVSPPCLSGLPLPVSLSPLPVSLSPLPVSACPSQHVCETEERDEVVVCELCEASVANFNQHMKKTHPGCGRSANRQGYRSNGSYVTEPFEWGVWQWQPILPPLWGSPHGTQHAGVKSKTTVPVMERYKGQAPDLLGKQDSVYEGTWDMLASYEDDRLTGEEEFELLAGRLGLSERRVVPEAVQFPDSDPLGASVAMVTATNSMEETLLQIGEGLRHTNREERDIPWI
ncbi:hypothetical protein J4Q44_G00390550, partial [Coregonus suidteri]